MVCNNLILFSKICVRNTNIMKKLYTMVDASTFFLCIFKNKIVKPNSNKSMVLLTKIYLSIGNELNIY